MAHDPHGTLRGMNVVSPATLAWAADPLRWASEALWRADRDRDRQALMGALLACEEAHRYVVSGGVAYAGLHGPVSEAMMLLRAGVAALDHR